MKPKDAGVAGLIDLEKRMKAIKVKSRSFLITGEWTAEQENIIYWAGTRTQTLSVIKIQGPRCEICKNYNEEIFKTMIKYKK